MRKWWTGAAVAALWVAQATAVRAQYAGSPGVEAMPDPLPYVVPGLSCPPGMPAGAPGYGGPPAAGPEAFAGGEGAGRAGCYIHAGAMYLQRQSLGHLPVAVLDNQSGGLDTGIVPAPGFPVIHDVRGIQPELEWGVRATVGASFGNHSWEFTGYYLPEVTSSYTTIAPGRQSAFFNNPPVGFEGDNGLWLQADIIRSSLRTQIGDAEFNYRYRCDHCPGVEAIVGVRYFDLQERLSIFTDDDGIVAPNIAGQPDPLRQATYYARSHNRIVAPQLGFEYDYPVWCWATLGLSAKGAWGANFVSIKHNLKRGDGLQGFSDTDNATIFSHLYEINAFLDINLSSHIKLRGGYNALWVLHVPDAQSQVDFDLSMPQGRRKDNGNIFFHGPMAELQFLF